MIWRGRLAAQSAARRAHAAAPTSRSRPREVGWLIRDPHLRQKPAGVKLGENPLRAQSPCGFLASTVVDRNGTPTALAPSSHGFGEPVMTLPDRLRRPKLGVRPRLQKVWPRHRRWVRVHGCSVPGCHARAVDFAHLRSAANAGIGVRPHIFGVSLCRTHHHEQHHIGAEAFGDKYHIDLWALVAEFARRSPDWQMRASLRLVSPRPD
jgi:Putative HNHc nuclease